MLLFRLYLYIWIVDDESISATKLLMISVRKLIWNLIESKQLSRPTTLAADIVIESQV